MVLYAITKTLQEINNIKTVKVSFANVINMFDPIDLSLGLTSWLFKGNYWGGNAMWRIHHWSKIQRLPSKVKVFLLINYLIKTLVCATLCMSKRLGHQGLNSTTWSRSKGPIQIMKRSLNATTWSRSKDGEWSAKAINRGANQEKTQHNSTQPSSASIAIFVHSLVRFQVCSKVLQEGASSFITSTHQACYTSLLLFFHSIFWEKRVLAFTTL